MSFSASVETQVEVCLRMASRYRHAVNFAAIEGALMSELQGFLDLEAQEASGVVLVAILNAIEKPLKSGFLNS